MKRLTMRDVGGRAFWVSPQSPGGGYRLSADTEDGRRLDRLAAYEDTGLEPETLNEFAPFLLEMKMNIGAMRHLKELLQAEKDGRLVVLPYKIGDLVYRIAVRGKYLNRSMETPYIKTVEIKPENAHKYIDEIGKTVFRTREEAEAALKKRKEEDNETD